MNVWEQMSDLERAGFVALVVASVMQVAFVVLYATRPWWRHFVGRALLLKSAVIALVLTTTIANTLWIYPAQLEIAVVEMWLIAAAITYQFVALVRQIRADRARGR